MATFLLRPQDGGRDIAIPVGKTTIGRGPFLGVTDKRVSRSHALVELTDGKLSVLPIHSNPTFYKACMKEKFVVLKRNEAQELLSGDTISLLPNTLFFKVVCGGSMSYNGLNTEEVAGSAAENAPSVVFDYHEKSSTSTEVPTGSFLDEFIDNRVSPETVSASAKLAIKYNKDPVLEFPRFSQSQPTQGNKGKVLPSKPEIMPAPPLQKTRKLPSWLIHLTSSGAKSEADKGRNRRDRASAKTCKTEKTATPNKSGKTDKKSASALAKQGRWDSDEGFLAGDGGEGDQPLKQKGKGKSTTPLKRTSAKMPESDDDDDDDDITPVKHKKAKQLSSESDEESSTMQSAKKQDVTKPAEPVLGHESCGSNEDAKPAASKKKSEMKTKWKDESTASNLPLCPYGSKCYRKNPIHFKEYSHPDKSSKGDEEDSDGSDDDKPECPYGTGCYRRNPQHKQDYKHTKAPERSKLGKSKNKSVLDNESDDDLPNTYDYNDSFLDDGDIDGSGSSYSARSDDSDWRPKGGDDDGDDDDEDVNELLSEARGFLRSKKMAKPV